MKLHLPVSLLKALWCVFGGVAATLGTSNTYAGVLHSQVSLTTYTDFGQNMGRYVTGSRVNALLSAIREQEGGVVITYTEGHEDYTLTHCMPSFESTGDIGAYAAIGYNYIATVQHNGVQNPTFTGRYIGEENALHYYGIEYRYSNMFISTPDTDYKITRLSKVITDVQTAAVYTGSVPSNTLIYRAGAGTMSVRYTDGSSSGIYGSYKYITGGIARTGGMNVAGSSGAGRGLTVNFNYREAGISDLNPLPFNGDGGDSGSPLWVWNEETGAYEYLMAAQAVNGDLTDTYCKGAPEWSVETMDSYSRDVTMGAGTGTVHIGAVTTQGETLMDSYGVAEQWSGVVTNAAGEAITTFQGVHSGINTWMSLTPEIDKDNWYAYGDAYLNAADAVSDTKELSKATLFCTQNLVFNSSEAQNSIEIADAGVDLGVGYARFSRAEGAGGTVHYSISGGMFNHAGYVVDEGVAVHLTEANSDAAYVREWRKVGEGELYIEGAGDNHVVLNVGGAGSVYLNESGANAYAAYNVLANTGATVVLQGGVNQIARDFTFGNGGGRLDFCGHSMTWDNSAANVSADGFTIHALTEEAVITNSSAADVTLTVEKPEAVYLGSFQDQKGAGALNIVYTGTGKWTLNTIATDLGNSGKSSFTVQQGSVELAGSNTMHALGSIDGRSTRRLVNPEDWHYADAAMQVVVEDGAEFTLGSHARLVGDVSVYTGGSLIIREGVHSPYEYIEGGQRLEDTTTAFYRQFYGLHGNVETDLGTTVHFEYSKGTTAEQVYTGSISGGADVYMNLGGSGATLRLSGTNTFTGAKSLSGGGLISDNGLAALGTINGAYSYWLMEEDAFIAANGATGDELLGMLNHGSQGMLALTRDQATDLNLQQQGFSNLYIGALAGKEVHYGAAGETLATTLEGGSPKWLLGGGGGNLIVDFLLNDGAAELVLGNGYTDGTVTLTNGGNNIGSITFSDRVTLAYTEAAALGGADVTLDYGRRMQLADAADAAHVVTTGSRGAVLVDKLNGVAPDLRGHANLHIGSSGSAVLNAAPLIAAGSRYRFGGITGTLTVNAELADVDGQATGLTVDAQGYSGGVLELARAASLTGDVVVRGYDADLLPADKHQGDITLSFTCDNALADAGSVSLQNGSAVNLNGTSQTFHNLTAQAGTTISSAVSGASVTVVNSGQAETAADLQFDSLVKQGDGRLILSGFNHVGSYDVLEGTLKSATVNSLYGGVVNVHAGATLGLANGTANVSVIVHDGGSLEVQHGETAAPTKTFTFQGDATVRGTGTLNIGSTTQLGKAGATFTIEDSTVLLTANGNFTQNGTLRGEGNATLRILGGDKTHSYRRVLEHLDVAEGATLTVQQDEVETNPTYEIRNITGSGELILSAGGYKDSPSYYRLNRDTDFNGTFTFRAGTGYSSHKYMSYAVIQSDNALRNAQVQMYSWKGDSGYITLGVDTENARIQGLSTTNLEYAILMAGGTGSDTVSRPVSTRRATLTITGSDSKEYAGLVVGGADGTDHGLSIVVDGRGTQTFSGSSVFNDVSALQGTLNITAEDDNTAIMGDITVARGASLNVRKEYTLNEGKTIHVVGSTADNPATLDAPLTLSGGTIEFSGTAIDGVSCALLLDTTLGGSATVSFSDTSYIQMGSTYLLANGDWSSVALTAGGLDYLDVSLNGTLGGLTATFSQKSGNYIWDGDLSNRVWTDSQFGHQTATFTETDNAVFTDAAQDKVVDVACSCGIASFIFDSSEEYTVNSSGGVVSAPTLRHTGSGTTVVNGGVRADNILLEAGELLVRDAALLNGAASVSGSGMLSIDYGEGTAINLSALGEDGIGALRLVSGTLNATGVLNVAREVFVEENATLNSSTAAFLKSGASLHLAGCLKIDSASSYALGMSLGTSGETAGRLVITGGGTATVEDGVALNLAEVAIEGGTMLMKRNGSSKRNIGTLSLAGGTEFNLYGSAQPTAALEFAALKLTGTTATVSNQNNSEAMLFRSLSGSAEPTTLNLVKRADSTKITIFEFGGTENPTADFSGKIVLSSSVSGKKRSAVVVLDDAQVAANASIDLASASSGDAILGLGLNADTVNIAGLESGSPLGTRAIVFSGGVEANADSTDRAFIGDGVDRELVITTAAGTDHSYHGTIGKNLNITVGGEGSQSLNGDNSAFNGTLALTGGTLALGNSGIGSESSTGGFNATLAGGTLELADNTVNLGTGTLVLSGSTTISLDAASTDPALSGYTDGADHENGYLTLTVLRAAAVENHDATLTGAGVLQDMEFTVTGTAITAQAGASNRSYFVNTAVQYGADATNTAYAQAHTLVLNTPDATLRMTSGLSGVAAGGIQSHGGTVSLAEGVTLQAASLHADAATTLAGEGRYAISCAVAPTLGTNVSLGDDWNGILSFSGGASNINIQLNTLAAHATSTGTAYSTVEFDGASGYLQGGGSNTFASDIILAADRDNRSAMNVSNGNSNAVYTFSGKVSGSGTFERSATGPGNLTFTFTGDVADWTGKFKLSNATSNTTLNFTGNTASREDGRVLIAAGVVNAANGKTLNVTVTNGNEVVLTGDFTRTTGTLNLTVDANAAFTGKLSDVSTLTIKSGASVQLSATGETPVQHSVGTIAFDGGNAYNRNLLVAEGVKLTAANINNAWGVGTLCVEGEMDVTSLLKFSSGGNGSTLNNIITGNGTINAAALEFSNVGTYNVTDLHELNVSGATTFNTSNTVNVSASTLNLNGTVTTSRGSLNLKDGAVVNINGTSGTNTLQNLSTTASSTLAFAQGTTATISGAGSLAAMIVNAGNLTLSGTYSLDGFDISQSGTFTGGQQSGNGFLTGDLSIRLVSGGTVQEGDALVLTYFGKEGSLNAETGCVSFAGAGQPRYDTFYVNKADTMESLDNAIQRSSGTMESIRMADGTTLAMDRDGAVLGHLVLAEDASATLNVTQSATIGSVEGLGTAQALDITGAAGKVLSIGTTGTVAAALSVENATLKLNANLTLAGGLANNGTFDLNNKALTLNGKEGGTTYTMGALANGGSSDITLNKHAAATFDKDASVRRLTGNAGSAVVVGENATLTLTSTDRNKYYSQVGDLDVKGTLRLKGSSGDIRFNGYENGQVFNVGHLHIDGTSGITYMLTAGGVNYTTDIVVKSLSGGGASHTLQVSDCYTGGTQGMVIDLIIGEAQDHNNLYSGKIQYGIGTSSAKDGSGMNLVLRDELAASGAVLDAIFSGTISQSATVEVDTDRAKVKGLTGTGSAIRTMQVSGTEADKNRVLEIVGDGNYTYGGKLGANLDVVHSGSGTQSFAGVDGFRGSVDVEAGVLNLMNAASVDVKDVTIGANATLGVYNSGTATADTGHEGTLTVSGTLAAGGADSRLNANVVMKTGSTLDASATGGNGIALGSSLTIRENINLSDADFEAVAGLGYGKSYILFNGVDSLTLDRTYTEAITPEMRVDAAGWFRGVEPEHIYMVYDGSNVGMYCMVPLPEPATSTLSLLALASLCMRRRRK